MKSDHDELIHFRDLLFYIAGGILLIIVLTLIGLFIIDKLFERFPETSLRTITSVIGLVVVIETVIILRGHRSYSQGVQEGIKLVTEFHSHTVKTMRTNIGGGSQTINPASEESVIENPWIVGALDPRQRAQLFERIVESEPTTVSQSPSAPLKTLMTKGRRPAASSTAVPVPRDWYQNGAFNPANLEVGQSNVDDVVDG